jgi:hypothetical protein
MIGFKEGLIKEVTQTSKSQWTEQEKSRVANIECLKINSNDAGNLAGNPVVCGPLAGLRAHGGPLELSLIPQRSSRPNPFLDRQQSRVERVGVGTRHDPFQ